MFSFIESPEVKRPGSNAEHKGIHVLKALCGSVSVLIHGTCSHSLVATKIIAFFLNSTSQS